MKSYFAEESTSLPTRLPPPPPELAKQKPKEMRAFHYAQLLANIAALTFDEQDIAGAEILRYLRKLSQLIVNNREQFNSGVVTKIFHTLPNLPIEENEKDYKEFMVCLLERALHLFKNDPFSERESVVILAALAKLGVDFSAHHKFLNKLLAPFLASSAALQHLTTAGLGELWQFCAFAVHTRYRVEEVASLLAAIAAKLPEQKTTISPFHKRVVSVLKHLLADKHLDDLTIEHPVGNYSLDIAFPASLINIEVDGPTHYRDKVLARHSRFRDFVLNEWKVIRIPYFNWKDLTEEQRIDCLLKKMLVYPQLLNAASLKRLNKLMPAVPKPDLLYTSAASLIPVAITPKKIQTMLSDAPQEADVQPEKSYTLSTGYINAALANKLKVTVSLKVCKDENKFFQLSKARIKKKERRGFEKLAAAAQLEIKFSASEKYPGQYRIQIAKNSPGLKTERESARALKAVQGLFATTKVANESVTISDLVREYVGLGV